MTPKSSALAAAALVLLWGAGAQAAERAAGAGQAELAVKAGQLVAQRNCGGCHAVAEGVSPLGDAPPFRDLHLRYRTGGLAELLERGMLADHPLALDEGQTVRHPRMPAVKLESDEVAHLVAYLRSLEPRASRR